MASASAASATVATVSIGELDPPFGAVLPASGEAWRPHQLPVIELSPGPCAPGVLEEAAMGALGLLVVAGLLVRDLRLGASISSQLLGPGDIVADRRGVDELLAVERGWIAGAPTRLAILDHHRLEEIVREHPEVATALLARASRQTARQAIERAISQLPRVESRLVALFWLMAERWGKVGPAGIIVPLSLTHETLGRLVGAQRPTVSLALKELAADGEVTRRSDGAWVLRQDSAMRLAGQAEARQPRSEVGLVDVSPDRSEASRPQRGRMTATDIALLHERISMLEDEFAERTRATGRILDHCRATRDAIRLRRRQSPERPSLP